ncbi:MULTISPECIES: HdeD family acid-resistance protein [unclassified Geodermatophilus]
MTASVSSHYAGPTASRHTGVRVVVGLLGLAAVVLGVVLLFQPVAAARTLALLVGLSFVVGGLLDIAVAWAAAERHRGVATVVGAILVLGGVLAIAWPGVTLFALALITGLSLIVHGASRVGVAVVDRAETPGWGWVVLAGAVNVVIGTLAIAWPEATVLVLSLVLGAQIAAFGVLLLVAAFWRPGAPRTAVPAS